MQFQVCTITQRQLTTLSQEGACRSVDKPCQDMAFILTAPSLAIGCARIFGLTAMWTQHQVCLPTLSEVAQKLMLLGNEGTNWPYAYARMNNAVAHAPLSSEGHIGVMTSGLPSRNALLSAPITGVATTAMQWPGGLPRRAEWEPQATPFWLQGTTAIECGQCRWTYLRSTHDRCGPGWHGNWSSPLHQSRRSTWPESQENTGSATVDFPWCPQSPSQYITSRTQPLSAGLRAPPPTRETENSPRSVGTEPIIPTPPVTLPPSGSPGSAQSAQQSFQPTGPGTLEAGTMPMSSGLWPPQNTNQPVCPRNCPSYRKKWTLL